YRLAGSNGWQWWFMDTNRLVVTFTPSVDSVAILDGNADLWTNQSGLNQDIGIAVSGPNYPSSNGQPEGWKESGGANVSSPNAANVQVVINVAANATYQAFLEWKGNRSTSGTIVAGAGPVAGKFAATCLSYLLVPRSGGTVAAATHSQQYHYSNSNGSTWKPIDPAHLSLTVVPPTDGKLVLSGNADLWVSTAGYNQDIGIMVTGGIYGTNTLAAWKESGGLASNFNPNAAFVMDVLPVQTGVSYTLTLVWKASRSDPYTIWAGAGPVAQKFSPTSLTSIFLPTGSVVDVPVTRQLQLSSNDGSTWRFMDPALTGVAPITPTKDCEVFVSGNADLWTGSAGYNQDFGIYVSGSPFPSVAGQPETWKESGGGTANAPNAAFVQLVVSLHANTLYTFSLVWKANRLDRGTIYAGAGPYGGSFSPTRLVLQPQNC
ncbi:MAG: hypothetical protein M3082_08635, partial [Candidatus Dormibacteraeota bacterium]|nr:hypothetical protein [Candidatus Dormibacteraeota bacterium]